MKLKKLLKSVGSLHHHFSMSMIKNDWRVARAALLGGALLLGGCTAQTTIDRIRNGVQRVQDFLVENQPLSQDGYSVLPMAMQSLADQAVILLESTAVRLVTEFTYEKLLE